MRLLALGSALRTICGDQAALGLTFVEEARTAPKYRLYSVDGTHAALVEDETGGVSVRGEIVDVDDGRWEEILASEPPGITQAPVELADGRIVSGAVGDLAQLAGRTEDISSFGDFAAWVEAQRAGDRDA
jgi:gamma-glutamylcyclotransferase (GGCT)/AIG2-like uncharacterized protein YtfP